MCSCFFRTRHWLLTHLPFCVDTYVFLCSCRDTGQEENTHFFLQPESSVKTEVAILRPTESKDSGGKFDPVVL